MDRYTNTGQTGREKEMPLTDATEIVHVPGNESAQEVDRKCG